jgi:Icc-related predicted phosphoesterase
MKIACMSDVHGMWGERVENKDGEDTWKTDIVYPPADVLVLAGDILSNYSSSRIEDSLVQLGEINALNTFLGTKIADGTYKEVIVVAGNHDFAFQLRPEAKALMTNVHYLQDSQVVVDGVKFWGSPWQPWFWDWAFNFPNHHENHARAKAHAKGTWDMIPDDTNVLITHGPPLGILDKTYRGQEVGCQYLRDRVGDLNLKAHIFGHIHHSYGQRTMNAFGLYPTTYVNAAVCGENYQPNNLIQVVEV